MHSLADLAPATVLVVDDEPLNIRLLARALSPQYRVKTATSGDKALAIALSDDPPDLILLDILMPEMDGYEVLRQLRADPRSAAIPVIFTTACGGIEDEATGLELGAVDYITKPFSLPILMARVRNHVALKRQSDLLGQLVFIDALTEIPNRRSFDEVLATEWGRCRRHQQPLGLILMDIDHFKGYNDQLGHAQGDHCLRHVAQAVRSVLRRPGDFVARYGGEEFVAVVPEADLRATALLAEQMRAAVEALALPHPDGGVVTLSAGVAAQLVGGSDEPDALLRTADAALYRAKDAGRNCVRLMAG